MKGKHLKEQRENLKLSRQDLADRVGLSWRTIQNYEMNPEGEIPHKKTDLILKAFRASLEDQVRLINRLYPKLKIEMPFTSNDKIEKDQAIELEGNPEEGENENGKIKVIDTNRLTEELYNMKQAIQLLTAQNERMALDIEILKKAIARSGQ